MNTFLKVRIDVRLTDRHVLSVIEARIDPHTGRARLTIPEICEVVSCANSTARESVKRLEVLGHIRRYGIRGRGKTEFEVVKNA